MNDKTFAELLDHIKEVMNFVVFDVQGSKFTLLTLLYLVVATALLFYITKRFTRFLDSKILFNKITETGTRAAVVSIVRYMLLLFGFLFIFKSAGFDLGAFSWLLGALGVGLGFGLQNITNNFVSGIIILFERPIKIGDRIQVGDVSGDVVAISMRSTTIVTNDNISIIVPNSKFINDNVTNWSHTDRKVRFHYPISVAYKENPEKIRSIVLQIANQHDGILKEPAPLLLFTEYGDNSLNFELVVWTSNFIQKPAILKSELYYILFKEFEKNNIEIPYPQRDIHIRSGLHLHEQKQPQTAKE